MRSSWLNNQPIACTKYSNLCRTVMLEALTMAGGDEYEDQILERERLGTSIRENGHLANSR